MTAQEIRLAPAPAPDALRREVGLPGAVLLGLGSIVGTGVFVSLGVAAGVAGPAVLAAIALAAVLAACNGLSSARLAATFPVSGGTYEYGHRTLTPTLGFVAGWTFLCAKTASAATAALGCVGYGLAAAGLDLPPALRPLGALAIALGVTGLVAGGIRRSNRVNAAIVSITLLALGAFVATGLSSATTSAFTPFVVPAGDRGALPAVLEATALMFVAFTGYGRIATLGEEVRDPARTIPRAIVTTLVVSAALYLAVGAAYVGAGTTTGTQTASLGAPLIAVARSRAIVALLTVGAITAMLGVLLNLVLGLSRVLLAMARRGDAPRGLAHLDPIGSPRGAVVTVGVAVAALTLTGDVKLTWSFSAFTVLVYYAITNLAALRLPPADLRLPRVVPALGLVGCLSLALWVDARVWLAGLGIITLGVMLRALAHRTRTT